MSEEKNNNSRLFAFIQSLAKDGIINLRYKRNGKPDEEPEDIDRDG